MDCGGCEFLGILEGRGNWLQKGTSKRLAWLSVCIVGPAERSERIQLQIAAIACRPQS
ncbi:hypothetical protein M5D96_003926 [Drosophila gunungcola]|uniref:Uncharacterized protein n=1 Tax=Drosophila gunungcola TaxID=103775 RepID=A0A9P9YTJ5_9MUSC|nr:hypothetical protein M5D96_003926 [Drosophila gunungcola]